MDVLTIIPRDERRTKGVAYVKSICDPEIKSSSDKEKCDLFWNYFEPEWTKSDEYIAMWNIRGKDEKYKDLQNWTNNALERYSWHMNKQFSMPYPSLLEFITQIECENKEQVECLANICDGKAKPPEYDDNCNIGVIPHIYTSFACNNGEVSASI